MMMANEVFAIVIVDGAIIALVGCALALTVTYTVRLIRYGRSRRR